MCDSETNNTYIEELVQHWQDGTPDMGFDCTSTRKEIGLLDFIVAVSNSKKGIPVRNWCNSCATLQQQKNGYLAIRGALDLAESTSKETPIYYNPSDQDPKKQFESDRLDGSKWSNPKWPNVITKYPDVAVLDPNGNPTTQIVPKSVELAKTGYTGEFKDYYYVFLENVGCSKLPMPVYMGATQSSGSSVGTRPAIPNNGSVYFSSCPSDCSDWKYKT